MATVTFKTAINMADLDPTDWFDVGATDRTSTSMKFIDEDQTITVKGVGFTYEELFFPGSGQYAPTSGTITSIIGAGPIAGSITGLEVAIVDIRENISDADALIDLVFGGADDITGSKGADILAGFKGADVIEGGVGADTILGGLGPDQLSGNGGADVFMYSSRKEASKTNPDYILDLEAKDTIDLQALGVDSLDDITARFKNGVTIFSIDVNEDGLTDAVIKAIGDHRDFDNFLI